MTLNEVVQKCLVNFGIEPDITHYVGVNHGKDTFVARTQITLCSEVVARLPGMVITYDQQRFEFSCIGADSNGFIGLVFYEK